MVNIQNTVSSILTPFIDVKSIIPSTITLTGKAASIQASFGEFDSQACEHELFNTTLYLFFTFHY